MISLKNAIRSPGTAFAASLAVTAAAVPYRIAGFHCDESGFLAEGRRLLALWLHLNFSFDPWGWVGYGTQNPKVGIYICGALWTLAKATPWTFLVYRLFHAALLAAACAWTFDALKRAIGLASAWTTLLLLLASPPLMSLRGYGLLEGPAMLFTALALRAWFAVDPHVTPTLKQSAVLGALAGLAISTRLHAAYLPAAIVLSTVVLGWKNTRVALERAAVILGSAAAVFVVTNPLLWTRPVFGLRSMTVGHIESVGGHVDRVNAGSWPRAVSLLTTPWRADEPDPCAAPDHVDTFRPNRLQWFSIGLAAAGFLGCLLRRRWRPAILAICAAGLLTFVSATSPYHNKTGLYATLPWTMLQGAVWLWLPSAGRRTRRSQRT